MKSLRGVKFKRTREGCARSIKYHIQELERLEQHNILPFAEEDREELRERFGPKQDRRHQRTNRSISNPQD